MTWLGLASKAVGGGNGGNRLGHMIIIMIMTMNDDVSQPRPNLTSDLDVNAPP